jgi:hypothetical protein
VSDDSTTQCLLFPGIFRKPMVAQFDQRDGSSDGGAVLLRAADCRLGLLDQMTACLQEQRQAGKIDHSLRELVAQRVFSIACGYPDPNDSARLASDPIHKLLMDRDPVKAARPLAPSPGHEQISPHNCERFRRTASTMRRNSTARNGGNALMSRTCGATPVSFVGRTICCFDASDC